MTSNFEFKNDKLQYNDLFQIYGAFAKSKQHFARIINNIFKKLWKHMRMILKL